MYCTVDTNIWVCRCVYVLKFGGGVLLTLTSEYVDVSMYCAVDTNIWVCRCVYALILTLTMITYLPIDIAYFSLYGKELPMMDQPRACR
jgi:hypothetical protein